MEGEVQPMIKAWGDGNQAKLDELINGDLDTFPEARKQLLDDRNHRWAPKRGSSDWPDWGAGAVAGGRVSSGRPIGRQLLKF